MVVDDEVANIFMLEGILSNEGYEVETAEDGLECLEKIRQDQKIQLILLDIMMPEMSGIEVLRKMQENNRLKNIPVIMVSALTDWENIEQALSLGAMEYIKKPIDEMELLARIDTVLRIKRQEEELKNTLNIKDDFIRMVAHDLRGSISSISGFVKILSEDKSLDKKMNEEQLEILKFLGDSSNFIIDYFNKMLAWSNIGQKKLVLDLEKLEIKSILDKIHREFQIQLKEKDITIDINVQNIEIIADPIYLSLAIGNLMSNAIKYTPKGKQISIYTKAENQKNILCIKDSGSGVFYDKKTLLNSQYVKPRPGTGDEKGIGLGIYLTRRVLDDHGFTLDFDTKEGDGTTFMILFGK